MISNTEPCQIPHYTGHILDYLNYFIFVKHWPANSETSILVTEQLVLLKWAIDLFYYPEPRK